MRISRLKQYRTTGIALASQSCGDFAPYFRALLIVTFLISVWAGLRAV